MTTQQVAPSRLPSAVHDAALNIWMLGSTRRMTPKQRNEVPANRLTVKQLLESRKYDMQYDIASQSFVYSQMLPSIRPRPFFFLSLVLW
jgi:hypothetical protein